MLSQRDHIRTSLTRLAVLLAALAFASLLVACTDRPSSNNATGSQKTTCPVPTPNLLPAPWKPERTGTIISVDGDNDQECLVIYRYNVTGDSQGPLGAVVFDSQVPGNEMSDLMTYRLLPWINHSYAITNTAPGTPFGSLGAIGEKEAEPRVYDTNGDGIGDELGLVGADAAGNKTTLSLYRWINRSDGYGLIGYFHGNARVEIADSLQKNQDTGVYTGTVKSVRTVDRLYDRSGLAVVYQYDRKADGTRFDFRASWLTYVDGRPANTCYYPEGQTLNYYNDLGRPVFDLRLISEDDQTGKATVCAGSWDISANTWRSYWAFVQLERIRATNPSECDKWAVMRELIEPGRISCNP